MRLGILKSIGHNIADSLASGIGLLIGIYEMDVFAEAAAGDAGYIKVDFLKGLSTGSAASARLSRAITLYRDALPSFCLKHGVDSQDIQKLEVRFGTDAAYGPHFTVTVAASNGRSSTDRYVGIPGKRLRCVRR